MNYLEQLNRAIDYIEENISDELIIDKISKEAGISKWHFQRVFHSVVGETIKEYTIKRRLSLAAQELLKSDKKIVEIAFEYKFESHEVFSRAFKRVFKINPSHFRKLQTNKKNIPHKPMITLDYLNHLYKGVKMEPKIHKMSKTKIRGIVGKIKSVNDPEFAKNFEIIPKLWSDLRSSLSILSENIQFQRVSLINNIDKNNFDCDLEYVAGIVVNEAKEDKFENLETKYIPEGEYAEFVHKGPMQKINFTMNYIYGSWFPKSGRKRGDGPDVSFYMDKFDPLSAENEIKILVPLK